MALRCHRWGCGLVWGRCGGFGVSLPGIWVGLGTLWWPWDVTTGLRASVGDRGTRVGTCAVAGLRWPRGCARGPVAVAVSFH